MRRYFGLLALLAISGCASPQRAETVWVTVAYVYTPEDLRNTWNAGLAARAKEAALSDQDIAAGRLLRVVCSLGTDRTWSSYAYLPAGMNVRKDEVLELRIEHPGEGSRPGWNPVVGRVERFGFPGSVPAYTRVPDWKGRGMDVGLEPIPLKPEQRGRYVTAHGEYVIKCRQDDARLP